MKLQLDTTAKTIKLEEGVLLGEFFEKIMVILPNDSWKEFKLLAETKIEWINPYPIIIKEIQPWVYPSYPVYPVYPTYPWITWYGTTGEARGEIPAYTYNAGVYNIDIQ